MTTLREAAQQALEAYDQHEPLAVVMEKLRAALAEPEKRNFCSRCGKSVSDGIHTCTPPLAEPTVPSDCMDSHQSGCDHCRSPLWCGTKCRNCGRKA